MDCSDSERRDRKTADEIDAFSKWRFVYIWRAGDRKKIKRRANRRYRQDAKQEIRRRLED